MSPIVYGYEGTDLPVYFSQAPVLNAGGVAGRGGAPRRRRIRTPGLGQIIAPNVAPLRLSPFEADARIRATSQAARPPRDEAA